ncbi:MAG TPA: protein translocase subunit SecF [Candidatus Lustribacter sp.]
MFFRRLNWNIVGWLKTVSIISYAIIALGLGSMVYHWVTTGTPLRLGLSFTGGTDVTAKFAHPVERETIVKALQGIKVTDAQINTLSKPGEPIGERYTIETQTDFGNVTDPLWKALGSVAPVDRSQSSISTVGPSLATEYLINALKALVIAIAIQFLYIAFRFGWNYIFGLVTIIALVRDSAMMIGIYSLANRRVDDAFLAAVLTVIGYSVMDTIVILDRIRENTKVMAGEPFDKIVNTSILQTMTRSVNTLATVVVTLVALLAFGGASLQNFAFALLVGICSGGYHSIFYSAPLVASFQKRMGSRAAIRRASSLEAQPRTVAEARAQARTDADRAEILAARKARRERERQSSRRPPDAPPKYKRRRVEASDEDIPVDGDRDDEAYDELDLDRENAESQIDPLDAQTLGHHDRDYELGHEEIRLNLDPDDGPADPQAAEAHPSARETPNTK